MFNEPNSFHDRKKSRTSQSLFNGMIDYVLAKLTPAASNLFNAVSSIFLTDFTGHCSLFANVLRTSSYMVTFILVMTRRVIF